MSKLYDTAPSDEVFEEVKKKAIEIWEGYDDTYGYATEKIRCVEGLSNIRDYMMFIVSMFDNRNKRKLASSLSDTARKEIADRIKANGTPDVFNIFLSLSREELVKRVEKLEERVKRMEIRDMISNPCPV